MGGEPVEHIPQVGPRIDAVRLARCHKAVEDRGAMAPSIAATERPVVSARDDRSERTLGDVVVDGERAVLALGAEHAEALVLRGQPLLPIERHEVERTRIVLRRRESRAELQCIGSP
jgi:hypothetical protein